MPSTAVKPRRRAARVALALVAVLVAGAVLSAVVLYPLLDARAAERCRQTGLAAGGDSAGVNTEAWLPPRWSCTVTDAQGRSRLVVYDLAQLFN